MAEVTEIFSSLSSAFQSEQGLITTLLLFTAVIVGYSIFVFYFYRFLARKNIIELNLSKYNKYEAAGLVKFFAVIFYVLEYIIILPFLTFFWFAILAIFLLILASDFGASTSLLITAALVAAVRATSYINENLSQDLAKMLPFTLLGLALTQTGFFNASSLFQRFAEIPNLLSQIPYYLLFIIILELVMRVFDSVFGVFRSNEEEQVTTEENN